MRKRKKYPTTINGSINAGDWQKAEYALTVAMPTLHNSVPDGSARERVVELCRQIAADSAKR